MNGESASHPLLQRLVSGAIIVTLASVIGRIATIAATMAIGRIGGAEGLGQWTIGIQQTMLTISTLAGLGMGAAATRFVALRWAEDPARAAAAARTALRYAWIAGCIGALATAACIAPIAQRVLADATVLTSPLVLASAWLVPMAVTAAQAGVLAGVGQFRQVAIHGAIGGIATALGAVIGYRLDGLSGATAGTLIGFIMQLIYGGWIIRRQLAMHTAPVVAERSLLTFGLQAMLAALLVAPVNWLCAAMVVDAQGFREGGHFSALWQWRTLLGFLPIQLFGVASSLLASAANSNDSAPLRKLLRQMLLLALVLVVVVGTGLVLCGSWAMALFGRDFHVSHLHLALVVCLVIGETVNQALATALLAIGAAATNIVITLTYALLAIALTWLLRDQGAVGILVGMIAGTFAAIIPAAWIWQRRMRTWSAAR